MAGRSERLSPAGDFDYERDGAGSYEPEDRYVVAVEPSSAMRAQRPPERPAVDAGAEALPFDDDTFDAAMAISAGDPEYVGSLRLITRR